MPDDELPDLSESERLALNAVKRFEEKIEELRLASEGLGIAIERAHIATKDLGTIVKEARDAVKQLSREEVRKYLAKESERIAQDLRSQIKKERR